MNVSNSIKRDKPAMLLVTQSFPYGLAESSFLKEEIKALAQHFAVQIISRNSLDDQYVQVPESVVLHRYHSKERYNTLALLIKTLCSLPFYKEVMLMAKCDKLSLNHLERCIRVQMRSLHFANYLRKIRNNVKGNVILYTYWNDYASFAASSIKRKGDFQVCRLHGGDLYELDINDRYQPYKNVYNTTIDLFSFISNKGLTYYNETYRDVSDKASVNFLGVPNHDTSSYFTKRKDVRIVSFSYVRDIKRIDRIIDTLSSDDSINIHWTHIGARYLYEQIKEYAKEKLNSKSNVDYQFLGEMKNEDALEYISSHEFDFLINVSSTEGMPMTMMEAFSMSIPVIGTKVGGVPEVVRHGYNGFLLDVDFKDNDLIAVLRDYAQLPFDKKQDLRIHAKETWRTTFYDKVNYEKFSQLLIDKYNLYETK